MFVCCPTALTKSVCLLGLLFVCLVRLASASMQACPRGSLSICFFFQFSSKFFLSILFCCQFSSKYCCCCLFILFFDQFSSNFCCCCCQFCCIIISPHPLELNAICVSIVNSFFLAHSLKKLLRSVELKLVCQFSFNHFWDVPFLPWASYLKINREKQNSKLSSVGQS